VEGGRKAAGAGGVVEVGRRADLGGGVEGIDAEEVEDEGGDGGKVLNM
jgi:hypothetical protein